jgi:hypothetical protein
VSSNRNTCEETDIGGSELNVKEFMIHAFGQEKERRNHEKATNSANKRAHTTI